MSIDITKYVLDGGVVCPFCGEDAVASNKPVQQTADLCWVSCRCANCESDWAWDFELVGIEVDGESHRGVPPLKDYARIERLKAALRRARDVMNCETSAYMGCDFNNVGFDDCSLRKEVEAIDAALAEGGE